MNRAPNTNGSAAQSVRARGGYDAYFAQQVPGDADSTAGSEPIPSFGGAAAAAQPAEPSAGDTDMTVPQHDSNPVAGQSEASASTSATPPDTPSAVSARTPQQRSISAQPADSTAQPPDSTGARAEFTAQRPDSAAQSPDFVGQRADFAAQRDGFAAQSPDSVGQRADFTVQSTDSGTRSADSVGQWADSGTHSADSVGQRADSYTQRANFAGQRADSAAHPSDSSGQRADFAAQSPDSALRWTDSGTVAPPSAGASTPRPAAPSYEASVPPRPQANPSAAQQWDPAAHQQQSWDHTGTPYTRPPTATPGVPDRIARDTRGARESRAEMTPRVEVVPSALSAQDLFAEIAAIRQAKLKSSSGMRGALNKVGFNLGLSPAEQRFEDRRARIRHPLSAPGQIAVVSVKGGVGRTTVTAALGSTFADLRPDRVVAIDANPDFGDLSTRTSRHPYGLTLRDLAQARNLEAFSAVHSFTSINAADLSVVASPWTTESVEALSGQEFHSAAEILRRHYNLLVVDCGTGVLDSVTGTVLQSSDAVVVVTPATVGGVKGAVATLNWLASHGYQELVAMSVVVIVHQRPDKPIVEVAEIEKLFATVARPTCVVPYDDHLAEGGDIDLRLLDKDTAVVFEELAATLADNFPGFLDSSPGGQHGPRGGER